MSRAHDIDNDRPEPLFLFYSYEGSQPLNRLEASAREPQPSSSCMVDLATCLSPLKTVSSAALHRRHPSSDDMMEPPTDGFKGKGVSKPIPIIAGDSSLAASQNGADDLFSMSLGSAVYANSDLSLDASLHPCVYPNLESLYDPTDISSCNEHSSNVDTSSSTEGKGKGRELPPSLPPLSFITTELNYKSSNWPSFDISSSAPGPSSYDSCFPSSRQPEPSPSISATDRFSVSPEPQEEPVISTLSHRRSLSDISVHSRQSISAASITKVKVKLAGAKNPGSLARKLLFKKQSSAPSSPSLTSGSNTIVDQDVPGCVQASHTNCLVPWAVEVKSRTRKVPAIPTLEIDIGFDDIEPAFPIFYAGRPSDNTFLRTKGRSYSSPFPLPSTALDLVPATTTDIFKPILTVVPNYFDGLLPNELRIHILSSLVDLHDLEQQKLIEDGTWTVRKALKHKWTGRDKGIRELFKLSRVSKSWRTLVFDGQLWMKLDLRPFPHLSSSVLCELSETAGGFIQHIDLTGHTEFSPSTLLEITNYLCAEPSSKDDWSYTRLTTINLRGCTALTMRSLHHLLIRSPSLRNLCLRGLTAVTNTTCDVLAVHCPELLSLDLSRCANVTGDGIQSLTAATLKRREHLALKELRLSGLRRITDEVMESLGKVAPFLEVLDLSYVRDLHNSAIDAFVSCPEAEHTGQEIIQLTAREAGRNPTDPYTIYRRVTRLRHLSLSSCIMLTDHACSHLAHAVPELEFLEMAGIGVELRDDGLVRLLNTTPFIRRLDLEDASEITDDVLLAISPAVADIAARKPVPPQAGHALEHLVISYASELTNAALLDLIRNCTRLRTLEADNTRISGSVVKEFVRLCRERAIVDAQVAVIDCRGVGEQTVKDLSDEMRPRIGWRGYETRKLGFLDARDEEDLGVGQDECDPARVAIKTFYSWQTVDAVRAEREKKRKSTRRGTNVSSSSGADEVSGSSAGRARWWSPSGRRSGTTSPSFLDTNREREGCTIM
ncbi:uncharacterized protein FIBRA_05790 [Fibroporia radiculosa]|uniref:F-box domain-containing protein n=1 Tax=Fibroporia radiculosa TaxID=599839 RepID=J4IAX0_9APHY|nr:uncharacterized protein FIBRA_05790 [Fibroporia radiculosa]CCM03646.1 predicted protein [Fibroporia radiculosa]